MFRSTLHTRGANLHCLPAVRPLETSQEGKSPPKPANPPLHPLLSSDCIKERNFMPMTVLHDITMSFGWVISTRIGNSPPQPMGSPRFALHLGATQGVLAYPRSVLLRGAPTDSMEDRRFSKPTSATVHTCRSALCTSTHQVATTN